MRRTGLKLEERDAHLFDLRYQTPYMAVWFGIFLICVIGLLPIQISGAISPVTASNRKRRMYKIFDRILDFFLAGVLKVFGVHEK